MHVLDNRVSRSYTFMKTEEPTEKATIFVFAFYVLAEGKTTPEDWFAPQISIFGLPSGDLPPIDVLRNRDALTQQDKNALLHMGLGSMTAAEIDARTGKNQGRTQFSYTLNGVAKVAGVTKRRGSVTLPENQIWSGTVLPVHQYLELAMYPELFTRQQLEGIVLHLSNPANVQAWARTMVQVDTWKLSPCYTALCAGLMQLTQASLNWHRDRQEAQAS